MICPKCGNSHKKSEGMTCSCGYAFVFYPTSGMTDKRFKTLVDQVSANGTQYFTRNQLFAQYCRRQARKGRYGGLGCLILGVVLVVIGLIIAGQGESLPVLIMGMVMILVGGVWRMVARRPPERGKFEAFVDQWFRAGRSIPKMITGPELATPPPAWREPDVYDYGVEKVVIVEHDLMVDLLVKNGFHTSEHALVISKTGYPEYLLARLEQVLQENPKLPVFVMHDATPKGLAMARQIKQRYPFLEHHRIIDLGLFPADVKRMKGLRATGAARTGEGVPMDFLAYGMMATGLALALSEELPFGDLMHRPDHETESGAGVDFDFG